MVRGGGSAKKTPTPRKNFLRRDKGTGRGRQNTPELIEEQEELIFEDFRLEGFDANEDLLNMEIPLPPALLMNSDGTGARLIITHIEVENFKSYYGRQAIGPFHKNFTAIIGPNGSGKSNVIDSLLFVFGYRASKIRSKKMSAMIHSSAGKEDLNSCTVSVHFQKIIDLGKDKKEIEEGSQFYVSRTVYHDSTSRYTLNGKVAQFKEIAKILRGSGIDLDHNRFLILQGEVEQISLMKPKAQNENEEGMLEYLEDIIGSNRLKIPINKLRSKLELLQEQRASQLLRVRYAEKEKLSLEEPTKEIISRIRIENALTLTHNKILSIKKLEIFDKIEKLEPERDELAMELKNSNVQMAEIILKNGELKKEQKNIQKISDEKQEQLTKADMILSQFKQDSLKMDNDNKRYTEKCKKIASDLTKEESKIAELINVPEKSRKKVEELVKNLEKDEQIIKVNSDLIEEKLALVEEQTASLREKKKKVDIEFGKYSSIEDELGSKLVLAQFEMENFKSEEERERRKLNEMREHLAQIEDKLERKKKDSLNTESALPVAREEIEKLQKRIKDLRKQEAILVERTRELRTELEHTRQSNEQFKSSNRLLQVLMEQKRLGKFAGIFGRLGDLGAVDEKFDVAISTTCGALDNIVVDSVNTAQSCIQFLKKEKLGIASFIALDKQQYLIQKMRNSLNTPENVPRLFDLIRVEDEKVLSAFYYALQDTLVTENIEKATRISMSGGKRWRTVTLKGEVVEVSGAMSGGGNTQKRGRIGQTVKVNTRIDNIQVKDYSKQIDELKEKELQLNEVRQNLACFEAQCKDKLSELVRNEKFFNSSKIDIKNLEMSIQSVKSQLEGQNKRLSQVITNPKKLAEMRDNIKNLKKEQEKINETTDSLRMETIFLTEKIDKINDDNVGQCQRDRSAAEERKNQYEKQITKEKSAISLNDRNLAKARARKLDLESDLEKIEGLLSDLANSREEIEQKIFKQECLIEKCAEAVKTVEENYKEVTFKSKELNANELLLQKKFNDLQKKCDEVDHKIALLKDKIDQIEAKMSKMKLYYFKELADLPEDVKGHENDDINLQDSILDESIFVQEELQRRLSQSELLNNSGESLLETLEKDAILDTNKEKDISLFDVPLKKNIRKVPTFPNSKIREFNFLDLEFQLENLTRRKEQQSQKGEINIGMLLEYLEKVKRYDFEIQQLQQLTIQKDLHRDKCEMLKKQRLQEFMEGFQKIGEHLKQMYQMITQGGDASLDLVDSLDPFSEGVSFGVRPPKKSWKQITNLSGGEKTLASLALVFGLHHYRPTPLYVMDEIDAALDFRNVSIISSYIVERTKNAQFIVISLRNNMFERGNRIVGIYKVKDCTYNAVIDPKAAQKKFRKNLKAVNAYMKKHELKGEMDENFEEKFSKNVEENSQIVVAISQSLSKRRSNESFEESGVRNAKRRLFTNSEAQ